MQAPEATDPLHQLPEVAIRLFARLLVRAYLAVAEESSDRPTAAGKLEHAHGARQV